MGVGRLLEFPEEEAFVIEPSALSPASIEVIDRLYSRQLDLDYPSPRTRGKYVVRSKGCVGSFPLSDELTLRIQPKVPVRNLFRMLEYAYDLNVFLPEGVTCVDSIEDLFESLASVLAQRVRDRARQGLYRAYVHEEAALPYVRGRLLLEPTVRSILRGGIEVHCEFEEHTADLDENRILAWTLHELHRFPLRREEVRREVRSAYRVLSSTVGLQRYPPSACIGRFYDRLNDDYHPLHALCRFFLEQLGPSARIGTHELLPFQIDMARLFEVFVERWLRTNLPSRWTLDSQHTARLDPEGLYVFRVDLVLRDATTGEAVAILDTKYKRDGEIVHADIYQVVTYATKLGTSRAFLVYPSAVTPEQRLAIRQITVQSLVFNLGEDIEEAGKVFCSKLLANFP
jgi:5-methylcytosine-specific restriction enzyme subunit McrC